ncbi:hypothetical protein ACMSIO_20510 [Pseudomonas benzopyrenica]|uniref:hypothetical protein n=1 Tax=Pseudomonas benzopyrenica TaxID=2993566 RepID=UPI0039C1DC39
MTNELLELLRNLAKATQSRYQDAVEQWELNWRIARGSNKVMPVLAGRLGLVDYMAAAQILDDKPAYEAAATAVLNHADELASLFKPQPEVLLIELSLAIIGRQRSARRAVAKAVSTAKLDDDAVPFERSQALMLAALVDLEHDVARKLASELQQASAACQFDKATTARAEQWANATSKLADRDFEGCANALAKMQALHFKRIERELTRLKRGASSPLMACDLLDLPGDALRVLLSESGYNSKQTIAAQVWEMPGILTVDV